MIARYVYVIRTFGGIIKTTLQKKKILKKFNIIFRNVSIFSIFSISKNCHFLHLYVNENLYAYTRALANKFYQRRYKFYLPSFITRNILLSIFNRLITRPILRFLKFKLCKRWSSTVMFSDVVKKKKFNKMKVCINKTNVYFSNISRLVTNILSTVIYVL